MKIRLLFLLNLGGFLFFSSCRKDDLPTDTTIFYKFGFEDSLGANFEGWASTNYSLVNDVPSDGGSWALQLSPAFPPAEGTAEATVNFVSSAAVTLKLTAETKLTNPGTGYIRLLLAHASGGRDSLASVSFTNTSWQNISLSTPANIAAGDKIVIQLSAGSADIATWNALFDNIELDKQ